MNILNIPLLQIISNNNGHVNIVGEIRQICGVIKIEAPFEERFCLISKIVPP
jgi:hypothetical protein